MAEAEAVVALHDHVHATVVEHLQDLDDRGSRPDVPPSLLVLEDEPELAAAAKPLADQLLVPRFEDVERNALRRQQHELERKEADLGHVPAKPRRWKVSRAGR